LVLGIVSAANAGTLHVPSEYPTIQAAMTAAQNGDTVLVADGTYTGPGNNNLSFYGKAFTVRSENGPENCIIDCGGNATGFFFDFVPPETVLDGFTITNGGGYPGGGIYMYYDGNPTILNCIITGNTSGFNGGGGILCEGAFPTIINCTITGNTAISVGGGGIYCMMSSPTIRNCTITGNTTDGLGGGIYSAEGSNPTISNSILWGNGGTQEIYLDAFSDVAVSYSNVQGGWLGAGNIDADPLFVDPSNGNYHCQPGSPATDSADNVMVPTGIISDLDGNPRFQDDPGMPDTGNPDGANPIVDMGAYEFQGAGDPIPSVWAVGSRYLSVIVPASPDPVAIRMVGHPDDQAVSCIDLYVQPDGTLHPEAVYLPGDAWGQLFVGGNDVLPGATYSLLLESDTGVVSASVEVTTWLWGDVDNNGVANLADVQLIVLGFQGDFSNATLEAVDLDPCIPNGVINLADAFAAVLAFQGVPYSDSGCVMPCGVE